MLNLQEIINLEVQLRRDTSLPRSELRARDREIAAKLNPLPTRREQLLRAWIEALYPERSISPGRIFFWASSLVTGGGLLLCFLAGWGLTHEVFAYDGSTPINILHVLATLILPQILLLALWPLGFLSAMTGWHIPFVTSLRSFLLFLMQLCIPLAERILRMVSTRKRQEASALLGCLRARNALYARIERWRLLTFMQALILAYNGGILLSLSSLGTISDLSFGWSTTFDIQPETIHALCQALLWPLTATGIVDGAEIVPTLEQIRQTQYIRFNNQFLGHLDPASFNPLVHTTWLIFLVYVVSLYGAALRVPLLFVCLLNMFWAHIRLPLHNAAFDEVIERLSAPQVKYSAGTAHALPPGPPRDIPSPAPDLAPAPCQLVLWRDLSIPDTHILPFATPGTPLRAGTANMAQTHATLDAIDALPSGTGIALLVESRDPPTKFEVWFLREVRKRLGATAPIRVMLLQSNDTRLNAPTPEDALNWQRRLHSIGDPGLRIDDWEDPDHA